jgi:dTDP-4-amino-4,6-dideoxygalactose transaminase
MDVTTDLSSRMIRLPLWVGLKPSQIETVIEDVSGSLAERV